MKHGVLLSGVTVLVVAACGEVPKAPPDATVDTPVSDDVLPDTPDPQFVTAIAVQGAMAFPIANATFTKVPYNTKRHDDENEFDTTTHRFTPRLAGDYLVCAGFALNVSGVSYELDIYVNSARLRAFAYGTDVARGCTVVRMAAGDYLEVWISQSSGNTVSKTENLTWDWLTIARMPSSASVAAATTSPFTVANQTYTAIPYTSEQRDELTAYDASTSTFTAPAAGDYLTCASLAYGGAFSGEISTYVNGVQAVGIGQFTSSTGGCRTTRLSANDTLAMQFYQGTNSPKTIPHDMAWNWMLLYRQPAITQLNNITSFTIAPGQFAKVPYTAEAFDTDAQFDVGTSTFTAAAVGDYLVCAALDSQAPSVAYELDVFQNGSKLMGLSHGISSHTGCHVVRMAQGDQVDIRAYQASSTSPLTPQANQVWNWLQISKLK